MTATHYHLRVSTSLVVELRPPRVTLDEITEIRDLLMAEGVQGMINGAGLKLWYGVDQWRTARQLRFEDLWAAGDPVGIVRDAVREMVEQPKEIMAAQGIVPPM